MNMHWTIPIVLYVLALGMSIFLLLPGTRWKVFGTLAYLVATAALGFGAIYLLGQPKPLSLEFNTAGSSVLGFYPDEPKAIYLWVLRDGTPKTLVLPWEQSEAEGMQDQYRLMLMGKGEMVMGDSAIPGGFATNTVPPPPLPEKTDQ